MSVGRDILNDSFLLRDKGYSNANGTLDLARHRWYFIKEAFSPYLVETAITDAGCRPDDWIIDPFCGSGTVPLVASMNGYRAVGIEVNPFLAFLAHTKLLQCDPKEVETERSMVVGRAGSGRPSSLETFSTFSEAGGARKWLFNQEVLRAFTGGWDATCELYEPVRSLFRLALLGAAMDTCNATRDGKALRYRKGWKELAFGRQHFLEAFERCLGVVVADLAGCPNDNRSSIVLGDSRQQLSGVNARFKLGVTSPPYLNSFDYTDIYRPELFLGRFITTQKELRALRFKTVRSHIQAKWQDPRGHDFGPRYEKSKELINARADLLWNKRIPTMIQAYFEDIADVLRSLYNLADAGASLWLIVSTSAYAGVEIPVDLIIADIGAKIGWTPQEVGVLRYLRTSSQHWQKWEGLKGEKPCLRESVVILKA